MLFPRPGLSRDLGSPRRYDRWLALRPLLRRISSYGVYIYGWPGRSQPDHVGLSGGRAVWWQVFFGSVTLALPRPGFLHGVEKWALRLGKPNVGRRPVAVAPAPAERLTAGPPCVLGNRQRHGRALP